MYRDNFAHNYVDGWRFDDCRVFELVVDYDRIPHFFVEVRRDARVGVQEVAPTSEDDLERMISDLGWMDSPMNKDGATSPLGVWVDVNGKKVCEENMEWWLE